MSTILLLQVGRALFIVVASRMLWFALGFAFQFRRERRGKR